MRAVRYDRYGGRRSWPSSTVSPRPRWAPPMCGWRCPPPLSAVVRFPFARGGCAVCCASVFPLGRVSTSWGRSVGSSVTRAVVGDVVWGVMPHGTFGAIAESVVVPQERVAAAPRSVSSQEAAALPASGTTALHALTRRVRLGAGQRLLVRGAAGGVGVVAVQLGASLGARVTALAGAAHLSWLRELGASETFDHRETRVEDLGRFDVIVDLVGTHMGQVRGRLDRGGTLFPLALDPSRPIRAAVWVAVGSLDRRTRLSAFSNDPSAGELEELAALVDGGTITPVVSAVLGMDEIARAHDRLERGGVRGKIVVTP